MSTKLETYDSGNLPTILADHVVKLQKVGSLTYIVFAETKPDFNSHNNDRLCREICARIAVPTELLTMIGRTILAGASRDCWTITEDGDEQLAVRQTH
jgi:hypothetical protein